LEERSNALRGESSGVARLRAQTKANFTLTQETAGREALAEFFLSEVEVAAFLDELNDLAQRSESYEEFLKATKTRVEQEAPVIERRHNFELFKRSAKAVGGKLFDQANDLVKGYIGGDDAKK
jgi:hypothetical protein